MNSILRLENVSKTYGKGDTLVTALHPTSLTVNEGEFIGIVGPSGSGKSTLLSTCGALLAPSTGEIWLRDKNITSFSQKQLTETRLEHIGFVFQFANLVPFLTVEEQLKYILKLQNKSGAEYTKEIHDLLKHFGLLERKNHYPNQLSGGERQRVAIARACVHQPDLILADEPTASLDSKRGQEVIQLLSQKVKEEKKACMMITHDEKMLALCDKVYTLRDGTLV